MSAIKPSVCEETHSLNLFTGFPGRGVLYGRIRIVKSFSRNLCPITKSFWNVCPANGFKWNGRANKLSEFVQIPRRLRSPCLAGGRLKGEVTSATAPSSPQVSRHPIFSSAENVISGRGGRVGGGDHGRRQPQLSKPSHHSSFLQSKFN